MPGKIHLAVIGLGSRRKRRRNQEAAVCLFQHRVIGVVGGILREARDKRLAKIVGGYRRGLVLPACPVIGHRPKKRPLKVINKRHDV